MPGPDFYSLTENSHKQVLNIIRTTQGNFWCRNFKTHWFPAVHYFIHSAHP